eukprot:3739459-Rhodomonas_salina.1
MVTSQASWSRHRHDGGHVTDMTMVTSQAAWSRHRHDSGHVAPQSEKTSDGCPLPLSSPPASALFSLKPAGSAQV